MPARVTIGRLLALLALCAFITACGDKAPAAPHAADGHQHADGARGHAHEHGHAHDTPAGAVPIVRYEEDSDEGPRHGVVTRLSTAEEPDFGWAEVKLHDDKGDLEVWLALDRAFAEPLDLPLDTTLRIEFPERKPGSITLRVRDGTRNADERGTTTIRDGRTNYFIFPGSSGADATWLRGSDFRALVRVRVQAGRKVLVSDDFELRPHAHDDTSK